MKKRTSPAVSHLVDYLEYANISHSDFSKELDVSESYLKSIFSGDIALSREMCIKLEKYTGLREGFWSQLETRFRHDLAKKENVGGNKKTTDSLLRMKKKGK